MNINLEYPPIFEPGFHNLTFLELKRICDDEFPLSKARAEITIGLEVMIARLEENGIVGTLWVNGSFLTKKINPKDVDLLLVINDEDHSKLSSTQHKVIDWFESKDRKASHYCDNYVSVEYPPSHPKHPIWEWLRAYWIRQFGFSRGEDMKGIASIKIKGSINV